MIERMKNVLKNRKTEGDKGFSLVELAVVIVIIGILVAIAIPVFANIQTSAKKANIEAAAANGAATVAANYAAEAPASTGLSKLEVDPVDTVVASGTDISNFCVTATGIDPTLVAKKGPGCNS